MDIKGLLEEAQKERDTRGDLHILRFYSSFVTVSGGKVIGVTEPYLEYCPLAGSMYEEIRRTERHDAETLRRVIKDIVESKIAEFGFFTENREVFRDSIAVPYGASEIMMYAMRKKVIDAAVVVCDGAGTVITDRPGIVQGIGARMNGLFYTSAIERTGQRLREAGCEVPFPDASIDQVKGAAKAAGLGYRRIAVTVNALMDEDLEGLRAVEERHGISVIVLAVCTTGASDEEIRKLEQYADLVWSCASEKVRERTGEKALLQLSRKIPVFVLTRKGLDLVSGYASGAFSAAGLETGKQYVIDSTRNGTKIGMGPFEAYLREERLPGRSRHEPRESHEHQDTLR